MLGKDTRLARELSLFSSLGSRYEKFELLGAGEVGFVYKAYDTVLSRWVAVKSLHEGASDKKYLRFQGEARALSKLNHINIVKVLDFGITERNELFLILDFVEGRSLEDLLMEEGTLDIEAAIELFVQICHGMSHAHNNGVIHRDLKPSNIMLAEAHQEPIPEGSFGRIVRIVDFGLAVYTSKTEDELKRNTTTGGVAGSPNYMSPEQIREQHIDERSDVYALGCIMFHCLSGRPPFEAEALMEVYQGHLQSSPPDLTELVPEISEFEGLKEIVEKALSKSPDDRFGNMEELANQLIEYVPERAPALLMLKSSEENPSVIVSLRGQKKESLRWLWLAASILTISLAVVATVSVTKIQNQTVDKKIIAPMKLEESLSFDKGVSGKSWDKGYQREIGDYIWFPDLSNSDEKLKQLENVDVEQLSLIGNSMDGSGLNYLKGKNLKSLAMSLTALNDSQIGVLNEFPQMWRLWVSATPITYKGLSKLNVNPKMRKFLMNECPNVDDRALEVVLRIYPNLEELSIGKTKITRAGIAKIHMKKLLKLSLVSLHLTDEDLDAVPISPVLTHLDLSYNADLTDKGILGLTRFPDLRTLRLVGCNSISKVAIGKLVAHLPLLDVYEPDSPKLNSNEVLEKYMDVDSSQK